jgi:hypothetical protein
MEDEESTSCVACTSDRLTDTTRGDVAPGTVVHASVRGRLYHATTCSCVSSCVHYCDVATCARVLVQVCGLSNGRVVFEIGDRLNSTPTRMASAF